MDNGPKEKKLCVLLVDDDAVDRELFVDAINRIHQSVAITEAVNGQEAVELLSSGKVQPNLIFLDLNMPVKDGRETLKEIRKSEVFKGVPVCILSTSNAHFEVANAYNSGANLFMVKPFDFKDLTAMLQSLLTLLNKYVQLPEPPAS